MLNGSKQDRLLQYASWEQTRSITAVCFMGANKIDYCSMLHGSKQDPPHMMPESARRQLHMETPRASSDTVQGNRFTERMINSVLFQLLLSPPPPKQIEGEEIPQPTNLLSCQPS
ncbi:hypothetical protein RRG08_002663 [Elysia crispata]|uniref:Uncharacterized protein n=1 Tax=Elysia crispata TaxID=231223 RepID=A0AAE1CLY9_9GAST|nr:hypothetical protein RRG08_002663 [Elysia crispata]